MRIAVLSDSHDNLWRLDAAAEAIQSAEAIVHCGDLCSPFMVRRLGELAGDRPVHIVWGNNDGDKFLIRSVADGFPSIRLHGELAEIELDGLRVAVNHYPRLAQALARTGDYDLVCYGHDHVRFEGHQGRCLLLNPGDVMGMKGPGTVAMVETSSRQVTWLEMA